MMTLRPLILRIVRKCAWAPIAVVIVHAIAGDIFGHEPYVDPVMHFLGGLAIALFVGQSCRIANSLIGNPPSFFIDAVAFSVSCTAALFWEFGEFFVDQVTGSHMQRSLGNTMRDLLLGAAGALAFLTWSNLRTRRILSPNKLASPLVINEGPNQAIQPTRLKDARG